MGNADSFKRYTDGVFFYRRVQLYLRRLPLTAGTGTVLTL